MVERLLREGEVVADAPSAPSDAAFGAAYRWMGALMSRRGIAMRAPYPVWAWHSCGSYGRAPDAETIESLLSDNQLALAHFQIVELEVPDDGVLLTMYDAWNEVLDLFVDAAGAPDPFVPAALVTRLLDVPDRAWDDGVCRSVQATLPRLERAWIRSVRSV